MESTAFLAIGCTLDNEFGDRGDVRAFFEDVFKGRYAKVVIPWRSVLQFYMRELGSYQVEQGKERRCACGCGQRVFGRKKWGSETCRKRVQRRRGVDSQKSPEKPLNLLAPTRDISGVQVGTHSCPGLGRFENPESTQGAA